MAWYWILTIVIGVVGIFFLLSIIFYKQFFKRFYDIVLSFIALVILSPLLIILTIITAIAMKGNPFFTQKRPGKKGKDGEEKIFRLIKFRTMTNEKDHAGNLLPDAERLKGYGKFLRKTSLDELPELLNIFVGNMSIVGPRPLLVRYLPYYTLEENRRHNVRPGLTGWAQVNGRNFISWEETFKLDIYYVDHISFFMDIKIVLLTIKKVLSHTDITDATQGSEDNQLFRTINNISNLSPVIKQAIGKSVPLYLPVYVKNDRKVLQEYLARNNIYCPIIWPKPPQIEIKNDDIVDYMYKHMLCFPIDQRYGNEEMKKISDVLITYKNN